jgi:hypothetical protein
MQEMEVRKNPHEPAQASGSRQKKTNRISGWSFLIGGGGGNRKLVRKGLLAPVDYPAESQPGNYTLTGCRYLSSIDSIMISR